MQTSAAMMLLLATLAVVTFSPLFVHSQPACRFASTFNANQLFSDPSIQYNFARTVAQAEGRFIQPNPCPSSDPSESGVGYHAATGMTLDGHKLSIETGLPYAGGAHMFTASSKESLHLGVIAQVFAGNAIAQNFMSPDDPSQAVDIALQQLALKVNTYDAFFEEFPGFGGFLPWVYVNENGITPTEGFNSSVPSLDNGQMFWGAYAVVQTMNANATLSKVRHTPMSSKKTKNAFYLSEDTTLLQRWNNVVERMINNSMIIFYESITNTTTGQFRTISVITDRTLPIDPTQPPQVSAQNYASIAGCNQCWLDDPYEGELFTNMAYLMGNWTWTGADPDSVWITKRAKLQAVDYEVDYMGTTGNITVERGWWFSGHEKWKFWMMPYQYSDWSNRVFMNGEKARTWNSLQNGLPSGFASVAGTANSDSQDGGYKSDCGIAEIAFNPVSNVDVVTPYSFGALFLASKPHAYVWYLNYLNAERGQTCFGSLEGYNRTGANFAPIVTWDTKITTLLAIIGGIGDIVASGLDSMMIDHQQHGILPNSTSPLVTNLDLFTAVVDREWQRVFSGIVGEEFDFALPGVPFPQPGLGPFPSCSSEQTECVCPQVKEKDGEVRTM